MIDAATLREIEAIFIAHRSAPAIRDRDTGLVYLMRCGDFMKIGHSIDPVRRLSGLQGSCPQLVTLCGCAPGCRRVEADIHRMLIKRGLGFRREWFTYDKTVANALLDLFKRWGSVDQKSLRGRLPLAAKTASTLDSKRV